MPWTEQEWSRKYFTTSSFNKDVVSTKVPQPIEQLTNWTIKVEPLLPTHQKLHWKVKFIDRHRVDIFLTNSSLLWSASDNKHVSNNTNRFLPLKPDRLQHTAKASGRLPNTVSWESSLSGCGNQSMKKTQCIILTHQSQNCNHSADMCKYKPLLSKNVKYELPSVFS